MLPDWGWLFLAYASGSAVTGWIVYKSNTVSAIEATIDSLILEGYLKSYTKPNGEIEILKHNEEYKD